LRRRNPCSPLAWLGLLWAFAVPAARASIQLDIPPRLQWDNNNGYCGECSIQQIALFFGTYISQYRARAIIDTTQQQDVWVPENSGPIFDALRLAYEAWDTTRPTPQCQPYLVWAKAHLQQGHPVIVDVFVQGESDPAYDHIIPATGFTSVDVTTYHSTDTLVFNDNYASAPYTRTFGSLDDTRAMSGNGAIYEYCIPRISDYGCAVTGIKDDSGTARPVSLKIDRWNEPNISQGASPVQMNATIQVSGLSVGSQYVLLRYNAYQNVPTNNYLSSAYSAATAFVATGSVRTFTDSFMSDATVIYRCVPSGVAAPVITALELTGSDVSVRFTTQAGRFYDVEWRNELTAGSWTSLATNVTGTGGVVTVTEPRVAGLRQRFYRVGVRMP